MTSKWRTFNTRTLEEDAVVFLWDVLYQVCGCARHTTRGTRQPCTLLQQAHASKAAVQAAHTTLACCAPITSLPCC